ncbi:hypothetical protein SPONN_499 [uncultured Candidatus Thioglobus sp.]|nr:hypothetical protein SPONN_499 [uncultured Candidatus Thioglobus sp.]
MNGFIFYCNIVYLNSNTLLPISREGNSSHLQNLVQALYTIQAWMNLDFGIVTCFFNGYDTYVSTWMQFAFPLYIWLLILIIVLTSRYSTRIAKLTTSNTVSVLATLLLLSYAKLLKTSIETFSSIKLFSLDGEFVATVWKQDATVFYLGRIHVWLFLMSLVMILFYILPFTLLIVLGPKLLANKWINKLKPFLDTFYGPYTRRYRYWPGLLLLLRLAILCTYAFISPNAGPFRLMTVSLIVIVLFISWMAIDTSHKLHRKRVLDYLELFFHSNLGIFVAVSIYTTQFTDNKVRNQQALSVAMVGSALTVFCGILAYQVFSIAFTCKSMPRLVSFVSTRTINLIITGKNKTPWNSPQKIQVNKPTTTTHSTVEMMSNNELRERLLTDS